MKRKILLFSAAALLSLSLVTTTACNPGDGGQPSQEPSVVTPITITLTAAATTTKVGEDLELTITTKDNPTNVPVTVKSSDTTVATIVTKEGKTYVHGVKAGTATITASCGTAKAQTLTITVEGLPDVTGEGATTAFDAHFKQAIAAEKTKLVKGTYHEKTHMAATDKTTFDDLYSFEVYSNKKTAIKKVSNGNIKATIDTTYGIDGERLLVYQSKTTGSGETLKTEETTLSKAKTIGEGKDLTNAQALEYVASVDLTGLANPANTGIANKISKIITTHAALENTEKIKLETLTDSSYRISSEAVTGWSKDNFTTLSVEYTLGSDNLLSKLAYAENVYKYANDTKGDLIKTNTTDIELTGGERRAAPAEVLDFKDVYFTDYTPAVYTSLYSQTPVIEGTVGDKLYVKAKTGEPATASAKLDPITITKVEPADAATISADGTSITLTKAAELLKITTKSTKGVEKTTTITSKAFVITEITTDLPDEIEAGKAVDFEIYVEPYTDAADLTVTATAIEGCEGLAIGAGEWTEYSISATTPGTAKVEITSPLYVDATGAQKTYTKQITVTEAGATEELTPASVVNSIISAGWYDGTGEGAIAYFTLDDTDEASFRFTIASNGGTATGSAQVLVMGEMVMIQVFQDEAEQTLTIDAIAFGENEDGTKNFDQLIVSVGYADTSFAEITFAKDIG